MSLPREWTSLSCEEVWMCHPSQLTVKLHVTNSVPHTLQHGVPKFTARFSNIEWNSETAKQELTFKVQKVWRRRAFGSNQKEISKFTVGNRALGRWNPSTKSEIRPKAEYDRAYCHPTRGRQELLGSQIWNIQVWVVKKGWLTIF